MDIITIGGATRDIIFFTDQGVLIDNKKDPLQEKLLAFEYGAKIKIKEAHFGLGGGACNTAVSFARLGLKVAPVIRIGNDKNGQAILDDLKKEGIETKFIQIDKKLATGFSFIVATAKGKDHVAFLYRGTNDELRITNYELGITNQESGIRNQDIENTKWYYISSLTGKNWRDTLNKLFNIKKFDNTSILPSIAVLSNFKNSRNFRNFQICWNPGETQLKAGYRGLARYLKKTDVLILNKDEATELTLSMNYTTVPPRRPYFLCAPPRRPRRGTPGEDARGEHKDTGQEHRVKDLLETIYNWGPKIVVITCGAKGAYVYDGQTLYYSPALSKKKVETTGAGDAFGAGFIAGLILYKKNIKKALGLAILNSGSVVQRIGAQKGLLKKNRARI